jgi:ABC-2 type transport system permease protein
MKGDAQMFKKLIAVFLRDMKVSLRNFIALYIIVFPIIFAVIINLFTPGISDTMVNLALLEEDKDQIDYFEKVANIELFETEEEIENRVMRRDDIIGVLPSGQNYYALTQGDEAEYIVDFAKTLITLYENNVTEEDTSAEIVEFGKTIPPMKKMLVSTSIMLSSILGGMLIAINIVEEKGDNTIKAVNVTPISRLGYIFGKSVIGIIVPIVSTIVILLLTGFRDVNFGQVIVMILTSSIISVLIGFIEGINNDDIINAAGNIKLLFLPLIGAIAAIELLADKWQKFFYWIPFYWSYKGNELVLSRTGTWGQILTYALIVLGISTLVFVFLGPKIRRGLE